MLLGRLLSNSGNSTIIHEFKITLIILVVSVADHPLQLDPCIHILIR